MFICFLSIIFQFFPKIISKENKLLVIPFTLRKINYHSTYNSTDFLNDNLFNNILLDLNMGTPSQQVQSKIDYFSECFSMQTYNEESPPNSKLYSPILSSTIKHRVSKNFLEEFNFENFNETYMIEFSITDYKTKFNYSEYNYIPILGLNIPQYRGNCPNFFLDIKKQGLINKLIWTFEYINNNSGNFVVGEDLSYYNKSKYTEDNYYSTYINLNNLFAFDSVFVSKNKNNSYINMTQAMINNNYGLIIGPNEYKKIIGKLFFDDLINKNICSCDIVHYEYNKKSHAGLDYFIYSCDEKKIKNEKNNYFNNFPNLTFSLKAIEYDFIFTKEDLFVKINDKLFFNVIFQTNYDVKEIIWYFGQPFYKKYTFSLNFDSKTIGFYIKKEKDNDKDKEQNNNTSINKKLLLVILISVEVVVIIILVTLSIIYYKKLRDNRKNRVNEINDTYEYIPENKMKSDFSLNNN